jgi:cell wall-associated NlpC family hydrolase
VGGYAPRALWVIVLSALATFVLLLATMGNAKAVPSPGQLEAQIDAAWNQVEPLIEQWNAVHDKLQTQQTKVAQLKTKIRPLAVQVELARSRVGAVSARMYMQGPGSTLSALLTSGKVSTFVDQLTILNQLAIQETSTVADAKALKDQYDAQEAPIDQLVTSLSQQEAALAAKRDAINAQIANLNKLRLAAYGTSTAAGKFRPAACPAKYDGSPGARAARWACLQAGKPYRWGSNGPSTFDCSGLTQQAWLNGANVSLPHNAAQQKQDTKRVTAASLQIGDLVFYYSDVHHVAIFVGNGWVMSAPTTGDYVRMKPINSSPINSYGRPG